MTVCGGLGRFQYRPKISRYKHLQKNPPKLFPTHAGAPTYYVGIVRRIRSRIVRRLVSTVKRMNRFFEIPEKHNFKIGDLVTCTCHGGVAVILELYDDPGKVAYPKMNMARIWWINQAYATQPRMYMHTINRLNKYGA